jgi:DNA-binding CsgD family transcriptional regulator
MEDVAADARYGDPAAALEVKTFRAVACVYDTRLVEQFDRDREQLRRLAAGDSWPAHALSALLAAAAASRGDRIDEVIPLAEHALRDGRLFAERGAGGGASVQALGALVMVEQHERALVACEQLAERAADVGAMLWGVRGRLRLARGDRERGLDDLRAFAGTCATLRFGPTISAWRSMLALALPADERPEAERLIAEELEAAQASGLARPYGIALRAAGVLDGSEAGIERLMSSVAVLERSEARLEHARSLVDLGALLRRRNRRTEAREQLVAGMEMAHHCGAIRLVERAREELRAAGARPRRVVTTGVESLTASELRVARLAAAGRTNVEIAQELWLTPKTVETHLSRAYSKLALAGQGSRRRLAEALGADTLAG